MGVASYRLVVDGELGPRFAHALEGMRMERCEGQTAFVGTPVDQAQLQGMIERIASLGLTLVSVTPLDADEA